MDDNKCLRCGKCCVVYDGNFRDFREWAYCRELRWKKSGETYCRDYKNRIGKDLRFGFKCGFRKDLHYNIPDCPYNQEGWVIHPAYRSTDTTTAKELKRLYCVQSNHQE